MIKSAIRRISYYLQVAYNDDYFKAFFCILVIKTAIFSHLMHFGIDAFIPTIGAILALTSLSILLTRISYKFIYLFLIDIVLSLLYTCQVMYFRYFHDLFTFFNINLTKQISAISDSIIARLNIGSFFLADIIILPFILFKYSSYNLKPLPERLITFILLFSIGIYCNISFLTNSVFINSYFSRYIVAQNFGIINYQIHDLISLVSNNFKKDPLNPSELKLLDIQLRRKAQTNSNNEYSGIGKNFNLIAIQVESLQYFVIGKKFNGQEITPNLNRLINSGIVFTNIFDQTSAGNSSDATFLANCSLYPAAKGTIAFLFSKNNYDSLAKLLTEKGYTTMVLHAYYGTYWNFEEIDRSLGFQHRHYQDDFIIDDVIGWGLSDRSFFSQGLEKIKQCPTPFYVLMRTLTTHDPFDGVTCDIDDFPLASLEKKQIGRYIRSMHYVDAAIGEFVDGLSKSGLLSKTILVIYGDHRARLPENELKSIGVFDQNQNLKIPLIISNQLWKMQIENDSYGGLIDLAPTICNILGLDFSDKIFLGKDLGIHKKGYVIFRDGTFLSQTGQLNEKSARDELHSSDLLIQKNCIPLLKQTIQGSN